MTQVSTIGAAAVTVLNTATPGEKVARSRQYAKAWKDGNLAFDFPLSPPDRPARPLSPELLLPRNMPKRRHLGNRKNMVALLHAIAHIEFNAVDLAWDIVARFGAEMPKEFTDDWVQVADDEARHFGLLKDRLTAFDAVYGDLPAHDGLWQSSMDTAHDLKARLAVVPLVLEARGLDVTPMIIKRFENNGDKESSAVLKVIYQDEITHVHAGQKWFNTLCRQESLEPKQTYQKLVRQYFKGKLKPPFNSDARSLAGLDEDFYMPLAAP